MFPTQNVADLFMDADTVLWVGLQTSRTDRMDLGQGNDFTIYHFTAWESAKGAVDRKDTARIARMGGRNVGSPTFGVQASVNSLSYSYGGSQKQTPIGCVRHAIVITCSSAS
jgi:hypothetical protein